MRFKFYEVSWDEEGTGAGNRYLLTNTLADARRAAREQAEYEASENMDANGRVVRTDTTTIAVQEYVLIGKPLQVIAAALVVIDSDDVEWSPSSRIQRGEIDYGRRWHVNYAGKLVPVPNGVDTP